MAETKTVNKKLVKKVVKIFVATLVICAAIFAAVLLSIFAANKVGYGKFSGNNYVYQIAHRGYSAVAPENTMPAFTKAGDSKAFYGAECDARLTKDGKWIISHDEDVERMTDGKGKVSDLSTDDISLLTIDSGNDIESYKNLDVATVSEYLDICKLYKMHAYIEVKETDTDCAESLYNMIADKKMTGSCSVLSFDKKMLKAFRELNSSLDLFLLTKTISNSDIRFCEKNNCILDFQESKVFNTVSRMNKAQKRGLTLAAWTVSDTDAYIRLIDNGVMFITVDAPINV